MGVVYYKWHPIAESIRCLRQETEQYDNTSVECNCNYTTVRGRSPW